MKQNYVVEILGEFFTQPRSQKHISIFLSVLRILKEFYAGKLFLFRDKFNEKKYYNIIIISNLQ